MRTDGVFQIRAVTVPCKSNDYVTLIPFGDVHRDSPHHALGEWREFLALAKRAHNPVFLGMGDYLDSYSTSERRIIYSHDLHESTKSREEMDTRKRVEAFAKEIGFMRGKLIGIMGGNHFPAFGDGTTGDQYLTRLLDAEYLGACCAIRLTVLDTRGNKGCAVDVFAHHGKGGGVTAGGRLNAVEKMQSVCDADIYLMGDNHARGALPLGDRLRLTHNAKTGLRLSCRTPWIGRTGSFLLSYKPGQASYVTDAALPPAALGWITFKLKLHRTRAGTEDTVSIRITAEQ
jgi:hypothetical protein